MNCPTCGEEVAASDRFCEACGADLPLHPEQAAPSEATCASCGGGVGADGYCQACGLKQPAAHDHEEVDLGWVAGVTDRGLHHPNNEDAMSVAAPRPGLAVAVVCDGVSSSANAAAAAAAAAEAAGAVLLDAAGGVDKAAFEAAAEAAQTAVLAVPRVGAGASPSCTFVAAVVDDDDLIVGWLGDSRAYWFGADGNRRLTTDDSWASEQVAAGRLTEEQAEASVSAHAITRWLGADSTETVPTTVHVQLTGAGCLLVCSDGLWNYASSADALAALLPPAATPIEAARHLTDFARNAGGHDNITVVVVAVDGGSAPAPDKGEP